MTDLPLNPANNLPPNWTHAGRLLRSITHDVNNQLGAILAYAELIALAPERHDDNVRMARDIVNAVRDSTTMLDTVATLVAHDIVTIETINLPEQLTRVVELFRFELDRGGAGIELTLPREVCAFPGVRTRIVRALVHTVRHAAIDVLAAHPQGDVHIRLTHTPVAFRVEVEAKKGKGVTGSEFPADLTEAREHLRYHQAELVWIAPGTAVLEIPRDTRLIKPGPRA